MLIQEMTDNFFIAVEHDRMISNRYKNVLHKLQKNEKSAQVISFPLSFYYRETPEETISNFEKIVNHYP